MIVLYLLAFNASIISETMEIGNISLHSEKLTDDQQKAMIRITEFMNVKSKELFMLLEAPGGCGKTYLARLIVQYNNKLGQNRLRILGVAMTHKARKVLERNLNTNTFMTVPTKTIAALLKKARVNSYLGHKRFNSGGDSLADFDFIIIDEASMIDDRDLEKIMASARQHKTKILFVGDAAQIPHPTQKLVKLGPDLLVKSDSMVFRLKNRIALKEIVRQKLGNPILDVALHVRENLLCTEPLGPYEHKDKLIWIQNWNTSNEREAVTPFSDPIIPSNITVSDANQSMSLDRPTDAHGSKLKKDTSENLKETVNNTTQVAKHSYNYDNHKLPYTKREPDEKRSLRTQERNSLWGIRFMDTMNFEAAIAEDFMRWDDWRDPFEARVVTYTNESVKTYNKIARNARFHKDPDLSLMSIAPGDLLMGYDEVGFPVKCIENGQDYLVLAIRRVEDHPIIISPGDNVPCPGYMVTFGETMQDSMDVLTATIKTHFFPEITNEKNIPLLQELRKRAYKVNEPSSPAIAYKHYYELKDQVILMESMYEFNNKIFGESYFLKEHPLLRTKVMEVIQEDRSYLPPKNSKVSAEHKEGFRSIRKTYLYDQLSTLYPKLVEERMKSNHMLGPSEMLADRFMFLEKDVDYGYSMTCHKAQASTYDRVYINDADIAKIRDKWNYEHNAYYRASKERNQLKYVALTRAKYLATILSQNLDYSKVPIVEVDAINENPFLEEE